ncbi:LysR family transcriptional regulator [Xinfangfangia sp. CPCC 101601]|uniref:LysR family transcriptional regulator n=1 Tax=Pseudogemmobacter lacusdianii TaxID=3069608 RepID=A0ABU0VZH1_9RHOB|nr:LysR family transcriptional regulator [Xinfangfangia sp. CPCC 101601]MDQ2066595.1 LysR family transcriptional regulator [Xinfangfangia sp. CPCC 101601]
MKTLKSALPHLNAMVAFEAVARHRGLTAAAGELAVAQSAVSRHIATLEERLGLPLLLRQGNRISVTAEGEALAAAIRDGLGRIRETVEQLTAAEQDTLTIASGYDLVQAWLMPRFERVTALAAHRRVMLMTSPEAKDFDRPDVAISIRFGQPSDWPTYHAQRLFGGAWFPVCAPSFLERYPFLADENPTDFLKVPLLHLASQPDAVDNWRAWTGAERELPGPTFGSYMSMMHEAIAGRGAALAWAGFSDEQLALRQLVRLSRQPRRHSSAFYILTQRTADATVQAVASALLASAKEV